MGRYGLSRIDLIQARRVENHLEKIKVCRSYSTYGSVRTVKVRTVLRIESMARRKSVCIISSGMGTFFRSVILNFFEFMFAFNDDGTHVLQIVMKMMATELPRSPTRKSSRCRLQSRQNRR